MYFFSAELFIIISKPLTIRLHCWAECSISVTGYITDWKPCYWYWLCVVVEEKTLNKICGTVSTVAYTIYLNIIGVIVRTPVTGRVHDVIYDQPELLTK